MKNPLVQLGKAVAQSGEPPRSDKWPRVRRQHLMEEGWCRGCGGEVNLEVHHIVPFHLDQTKELDNTNLITLCEAMGKQCHLRLGHFGNWHKFNPQVREQCVAPQPK